MSFALLFIVPVIDDLFFGLHWVDFFLLLVGDNFFIGDFFSLIGVYGKLEIPTSPTFVDTADFPLLSSIVSIL